ncbi:MAG: phage antirepressor protein [Nanoarchaeota archaeon]|nr:phage antirepressor protein [Nanoarchaeota archaeon]
MNKINSDNALVVFQGKDIRRKWHNGEWQFVIEDIVLALTASTNPKGYIKDMRRRDKELSKGWGQIATPLKFTTAGGNQNINCANTEGIFRIVQSIPSKKAEPFKQWLARVGYERIQEIENPELAQERMKQLYEQKGYSKEWIEKRLRGIAIRQELTDEWKQRGVNNNVEFSILTNEISKATFGKTIGEYKALKDLKRQNLRDHMTDMELIFNMLGEKITTEVTTNKDAQNFEDCSEAAKKGGGVAGRARIDAEKTIGKSIVTDENYLETPEKVKRLENKNKKKNYLD